MNIVSTIEARMTSSRFPGKVLMPANGKTMLEHLVGRLRRVPSIGRIVVATTVNRTDDPIVEQAARLGVGCFRGSEEDVLARVLGAADSAKADLLVEITGDCPIIDPLIVEQTIRMFLNNRCEYVSNTGVRSYPDGMDTQVFRVETLRRSEQLTRDPADREHVTMFIRNHPEIFSQLTLVAPPDLHWPELRLTLDTRADYDLIRRLIERFGDAAPCFGCRDVVDLLRAEPGWLGGGNLAES